MGKSLHKQQKTISLANLTVELSSSRISGGGGEEFAPAMGINV